MNYSTYTATPDLAKAIGILEMMLKQEKFFPTFEWNGRDETDERRYLVWDMESDCFRGPWPMVGRVNRTLQHTSDKEKMHRWTSTLQPVREILTKPDNTNYHNGITAKFWAECWSDEPRYLFACANNDNTGSWERITPADALDDFRDFFEMSSILDVLYWFDSHKKDTGPRNILRAPCRADNIAPDSNNHNLVRTIDAMKRMI